jgi:membrane protein DedA with SNARE-associated domain
MFKGLLDWYSNALETCGPLLIGLMMAMESTIVPLPSEVIIPPAAHLAYTGQNPRLTIATIIIAATLGSWIGAAIMYWASRVAGRPLVLRYGRYAMISPEKVEGAERWSTHYGSMGVFIARLLPVVRHLIGIPAGIVRMDFRWYSLYTLLGSALWCSILCWLGIKIGQDKLKGEYHKIVITVSGVMVVLGAVYYFFVHRHMKKKPEMK